MTDEAYSLVETPRFSPGRVLADSFETLFRTAPRLLGIVLIIAVPLFVWLVLGGKTLLVRFSASAGLDASNQSFNVIVAALILLVGLITLGIQGAVTDAAFQDLLGEEVDILQSLARALVMSFSLIGAGLFAAMLFGFGAVVIGLAAGLVAGALHWIFGAMIGLGGIAGLAGLMARLWLLIPVIIVEGTGPVECVRRSMRLTEGNAWKLFALMLTVYVPQLLVKAVLVIATPVFGEVIIALINILLSGLFITFNAVVAVVIYGHLRAIQEGSGTAVLAEVFE